MSWVDEIIRTAAPGAAKVIYWMGEVEFLSAAENDTAGRTLKLRVVRGPQEQHLINPFAKATRKRSGFAGTHFTLSLAGIGDNERMEWVDTVVMLNWADGPSGATVTLKIPDTADVHPFMFCVRPSANVRGTRWMAVFVELDDGHVAVRQLDAQVEKHLDRVSGVSDAVAGSSGARGQTYAQGVALLIQSQPFLDYLGEMVEAKEWTFAAADQWLKSRLEIASKSELNVPSAARQKWEKIRSSYLEWAARGARAPRLY